MQIALQERTILNAQVVNALPLHSRSLVPARRLCLHTAQAAMEFQVETEFLEVKSPIDRFRQQWEHQPGALPFLKQRNVILQNPDLIQYAELARVKGWTQPLIFALQGLLVIAVIVSALNWWITRERGAQADAIAAIRAVFP